MKKVFIAIICLLLFTGCKWQKDLTANSFGDLWNEVFYENDSRILVPVKDRLAETSTKLIFETENAQIDQLRKFLITGEEQKIAETDEIIFREGLIKIAAKNNSQMIEKLKKIFDLTEKDNPDQNPSVESVIKDFDKNLLEYCRKDSVKVICEE